MVNMVYNIITEKIIEKLEAGVIPWKKPWKGQWFIPKNLLYKNPFRGINLWLLQMEECSSPYWLTMYQINSLGGRVMKGEKSKLVIFYNWTYHDRNNKSITKEQFKALSPEDKKMIYEKPFVRYHRVFNVEQCNGLDNHLPPNQLPTPEFLANVNCEEIVKAYKDKPDIRYSGYKAYYDPEEDFIRVPKKTDFNGTSEYYSTLFHEMVHSTGNKNRLDRELGMKVMNKKDEEYSKEELIAEMGSTFLMGNAGLESQVIDNSSSYIDGWLNVFKKDNKMLVIAGSQAQKAVDYIQRA